jgi:superfamily II DNA helicase RecQ
MLAFRRGDVRVLVTKPSIAGWGVNWQHCSQVAFVGLSNSFEQYYQAIRRTWRFGQARPVDCYIITSTAETGVLANLRRKQKLARELGDRMVEHMADALADAKTGQHRIRDDYTTSTKMEVPAWM